MKNIETTYKFSITATTAKTTLIHLNEIKHQIKISNSEKINIKGCCRTGFV